MQPAVSIVRRGLESGAFFRDNRRHMRVLVIEDELQLARHIVRALYRSGHDATAAHDGDAGLRAALDHPPEIIVLDLNLPKLDGLDVLLRLKKQQCPSRVIILTARGDVASRITGLKAGADDYLPKPFSMEELLVRVEALGRRAATPTASDWLEVGDLRMDVQHRRVTRSGQALTLSPREFDMLQVLMQEPGRVFSRTELCERVWQREHEYEMRTVDILVGRLRKKVDAGYTNPLIHTSRAIGYSIAAPARKAHATAA
jgi:DNA-binding response OmpR family regulator